MPEAMPAPRSPDAAEPGGKLTRRDALRMLSSVPLLPLGGAAATLLAGCATRPYGPVPVGASFNGMAAPVAAPARATTTTGARIEVAYSDGSRQLFDLAHRRLFLTGDELPDGKGGTVLAGGCRDIAGRPIMDTSGAEAVPLFSDCPDGMSLLALPRARVAGVKGNPLFAVVQFEYVTRNAAGERLYGQVPAPMAVVTLDQDPATGALGVVKYHPLDTAAVNGLWTTCAASLTPWNTHLSSEEFEPDAVTAASNPRFRAFSRNLYGDETKANPYHYGHMPEVSVNADGTGRVVKHYGMGRISHELAQVMPDRRTVLMSDDATNAGLFLFVADRAGDLSAGTLYAAKAKQHPGVAIAGGGAFDLAWVRLGHAKSAEIEALAGRLTWRDIMEVAPADPGGGFREIPVQGKRQWVRIRPGMETAAAFLETRRWAALQGASMAFTKMEGLALNEGDRVAYVAMSFIDKSMTDGSTEIRVDGIRAGAIYGLPLAGGRRDTAGAPIDSAWVPVGMATLPGLVGRDLAAPDALGNTADPDRIANPDNIKYSDRLRTLFIGEDSDAHINNFVWAYSIDTGTLVRILSVPAGAEATGLQVAEGLNGFTYIMSNFQHAGDWKKGRHDGVKDALGPLIDARYRGRRSAAVGYVEGVPVFPAPRPRVA